MPERALNHTYAGTYVQKTIYFIWHEILVGQVWNLPLRQMCSKGVFKKNHLPERASVGDGVLDVPRYGVKTSCGCKKYSRRRRPRRPEIVKNIVGDGATPTLFL